MRALAYMSCASTKLSAVKLSEILRSSERFNRIAGVTGVMLFDGLRFFQYLEGPLDGLNGVMGRVRNATSHEALEILLSQDIGQRLIPYWSMQIFTENQIDLQALKTANWGPLLATPSLGEKNDGMDRLLAIVRRRLDAA